LGFRLFEGSFRGPVFIDFLRRLLRDLAGRKVHLIVDGHPVHRARLVSGWVARHAERIQLHFLPGYTRATRRSTPPPTGPAADQRRWPSRRC
jgi:hypothetical protein